MEHFGREVVAFRRHMLCLYTVFHKRHPFYFYDNFVRCRPIFRPNRPGTIWPIVTGLPPAGFCHPMRLSDFIDFISVEREREDDDVSCSRRRIPLSQLEASHGGAIV